MRPPCGIRYAIIRRPATSAITPLLACSRLGYSITLECGYLLLLSIALCQRLFRPRAKAAYSSRSRCSRSCSRVCLGDTRYDKNRIRSDPPLAECTVVYHASSTQNIVLQTTCLQYLVFCSRLWIISTPAGPMHHSPLDSHIW